MPDDFLPRELRSLDTFELVRLGKSSVTLGGVLTAVVIIVFALIAARLAAGAIRLRSPAPVLDTPLPRIGHLARSLR